MPDTFDPPDNLDQPRWAPLSPLTFSSIYPHLSGSHGSVALCLTQKFVSEFCDAMAVSAGVQRLEVTLLGPGRFRFRAELTNSVLHFFGSMFLKVLSYQPVD